MFRDESSHVINKANKKKSQPSIEQTAPSRIKAVSTPTIVQRSPTDSDSSTSPEQLPWAPVASSASIVTPRRGWSPAQPPPTQPFSYTKFDEKGKEVSETKPRRTPRIDASGPLSYSLSPSYQERGVNLFVARYISVVSIPSNQGPP